MNKIKVLEVIRQGEIGGGESHVLDLVSGFDKNLITPIVMAFTNGHMIETLTQQCIKCYIVETQSAFDYKVQNKIIEIIKQENINLIHAHGSRAASNMIWAAKRLKKPLVYTVHGWSFHQDQPYWIQKLRAWSEKIICKCCQQVICVSESNKLSGKKAFNLNSCQVIENGINLERFNYHGNNKNLRNQFGFSEDDILVGLIARITLQKDPLTFIQGIALAHKQNPRIKGLVIGEGDMKDEIVEYIKQHQMDSYIHTTPFRTDVPDILNTIDIYCLPSLWEGLSIALLEAMAMKKPVIVTPTDGCKELIINGNNGLVVNFKSPDEIAHACLQYINTPTLIQKCTNTAYKMVEERFNAQRVSDTVLKIYQDIVVFQK